MTYFPLEDEGLPIKIPEPLSDGFLNKGTIPSYLGNRFSKHRLRIFILINLLVFSLISMRLAKLELLQSSDYRNLAEGNRIRVSPLKAKRGLITDINGKIVAENIPLIRAGIIPAELPKKDALERQRILKLLAETIGGNREDIEAELAAEGTELALIVLPNILSDDQAIRLLTRFVDTPGITTDIISRRRYPFSQNISSLAHLIGYQGKISPEEYLGKKDSGYLRSDLIGKTGLERSYESALRGVYGKSRIEVNAAGGQERIIESEKKIDGATVRLTLNLELQQSAERALTAALKRKNLKRGAVVALDPRNGAVRALVSLPSFDNNQLVSGISSADYSRLLADKNQPLFPRAIAGEYPSGSVIKPIFAAAGLAAGIITPETQILSTGGLRVGKWFFPDWKAGGHGRVNIRQALAESVNTFFYLLGGGYESFRGLGIENLVKYAREFGLGSPTDIDLPNEADGFLGTPQWKSETRAAPWYIGDTYHFAIGQGDVLVTPLQIAAATAVIANGGTLYRPMVAHSLIHANGREDVIPRKVIRNNITATGLEIVKEGLRAAVTSGSARNLNDLEIEVAGKTGTAQPGGIREPHAWFTGFAPYHEPEIVITVLVEEGGEGSSIAVPIAKEIFQAWWKER